MDPPITECEHYGEAAESLFCSKCHCLYALLTSKERYIGIESHSGSSSMNGSTINEKVPSAPNSNNGPLIRQDVDEIDLEVNDVVEYATAIGADLAVGTLAFAGAAGMCICKKYLMYFRWLVGFIYLTNGN